jgi:hypothetical protein
MKMLMDLMIIGKIERLVMRKRIIERKCMEKINQKVENLES